MGALVLVLFASAHGAYRSGGPRRILTRAPAATPATTPAATSAFLHAETPKRRGPSFKLPPHLALPALSYGSLAAATAGTIRVLSPLATWQGTAIVGYCIGLPVALVLGQLAMSGGSGVAAAMGGVETQDARLLALARDAAAVVGVPTPKVFEVKNREPNAFAAANFGGRDTTVAVTSGLREVLSEAELGAVLAHEMGHLRHRDVARNIHVAAAAAGLGGIYDVGRILLDSSSRKKRKDKDDDSGGAAGLGLALMAGGAVTQGVAHGLRLMASRDAELKADRAAAAAYGSDTMINALRKIDATARSRPASLRESKDGKAFAFAMISDGPSAAAAREPRGSLGKVGAFFGRLGEALRTHPTLDKRVEALENAAAAGLVPRRGPLNSRWF